MKLLADENIRRDIVSWLRNSGHDVAWICEASPGMPDESILERGNREDRMILSADLDFGEMLVRHGRSAPGILLLRVGLLPPPEILPFFQHHWEQVQSLLPGNLVILSLHRIRARPLNS